MPALPRERDVMRAISRRRFLESAIEAGAGFIAASAVGGLSGCAHLPEGSPQPISGRRVFADLHLHTSLNAWLARTPLAIQNPSLLAAAQIEFESEKAAGAALIAGIEKQSIQMTSCGVCVLWPEDDF